MAGLLNFGLLDPNLPERIMDAPARAQKEQTANALAQAQLAHSQDQSALARHSLSKAQREDQMIEELQNKSKSAGGPGTLSEIADKLIGSGNPKWMEIGVGLKEKAQMRESMQGSIGGGQGNTLNPDKLDMLGANLAINGHPGAATVMNIADKKRKLADNAMVLQSMRSQPAGLSAGEMVPGTTQQAVQDIPPEDMRAALSVAQSRGPMSATVQPGDASPLRTGTTVLPSLMRSESTGIAAAAKALQAQIDSGTTGMDPAHLNAQIQHLVTMDAGRSERQLAREENQANRVDYRNQFPPAARGDATGKTPPSAASNSFTPEALNMTARQYLTGDRQSVQGFARNASARVALQNEIVAEATRQGMTGEDIAAKMADFSGIMAGSRSVGTRSAQIQLASSEADKMISIVEDQSKQFGRTTFIPFNMAIKAFDTNTGAPEVKAFGASINSLVNVYARAINPVGVPTDSDKHEARNILAQIDSPQQVTAVLGILRQEMQAARESPGEVRKQLREAVKSGSAGTKDEQPHRRAADSVRVRKWNPVTQKIE